MGASKDFKTDLDREKNGLFVEYGDIRVLLARAGGSNTRYLSALRRATTGKERILQANKMKPAEAIRITAQVFSETVILDWYDRKDADAAFVKGIDPVDAGEQGDVLLPVTQQNIYKVLMELPSLFEDIQADAGRDNLYRLHLREEDLKN